MKRTSLTRFAIVGTFSLIWLLQADAFAVEPSSSGSGNLAFTFAARRGASEEGLSVQLVVAPRFGFRRGSRSPSRTTDGRSGGNWLRPPTAESQGEGNTSATDAFPVPKPHELQKKLVHCLSYYFQRPESTRDRSPWGAMHAAIAYGVESQLLAEGKKVNALGWLCWNGACQGQRLLYVSNGQVAASEGPGLQGHGGQFLSILAQSKVKTDYPIKVGGREFTVADLIEYEKQTCQGGAELTFKLIGLMHYLDSDDTWQNQHGQSWSIPRLIREELAQSVVGAACGGTHRMMGISYAVRNREKRGEELSGQWLRAKNFVDAYHKYAFRLQNPDGSFSTNWFEGRGNWGNADQRLESTGHTLEWLVYSLPEDQLSDPRLTRAADYLIDLMMQNRNRQWEIGPKGHALHALVLYDQRAFGTTLSLATKPDGDSDDSDDE